MPGLDDVRTADTRSKRKLFPLTECRPFGRLDRIRTAVSLDNDFGGVHWSGSDLFLQ